MHEEDRQRAMAAYTALFDQADDEQALLQALNTPLVQAVQVSRAYNSTDAEAIGEDGIPPYLQVIYDIGTAALSEQPIQKQTDDDQFSLFDEQSEAAQAARRQFYVPQNSESAGDAPEAEPSAVEETAAVPAEPGEAAPDAGGESAAEDMAAASAAPEESGAETADSADPAADEAAAKEGPEQELDQKVSDFLNNFSLKTGEADELPPDTPSKLAHTPRRIAVDKTLRKPRVPLLILYILFAVPLTLVGIVVLLLPTVVSLSAGVLLGATGVLGFLSVFSSFSLMCDMLVAAGASMALVALGLLFLWLFIWLIGGAIAGLVRTVVDLGGKWCYKEVPAE